MLGIFVLVGLIGATAWWFYGPTPEPTATTAVKEVEMDVVCTGRVDAAGMIIALEPARAGRVVAVSVNEGDAVKAGQEVLRLDATAAQAQLAQADAVVEASRVEVDAASADAERAPNQLAARQYLLAAAASRVDAARKLLQQRKEQQTVTPVGKAELEAMEAQIRELEQLEAAERGALDDLKRSDPRLRVRLAQAKLKAAEADRDYVEKALRETVLTAPGDGTILRLQASVGGIISPGSPLPAVVFAPAGPLIIRAEVDQEFLGRVKPGMSAVIQDENRADGPTWKGRVRSVAGWVAMRRSVVLDPGELNDVRTVECILDIDPPADNLWIGQRMRVRLARN